MHATRMQHLIWAKNCTLRAVTRRRVGYLRMARFHFGRALSWVR